MTDEITLPPLSEPTEFLRLRKFSAEQVREYARAAVEADRARRGKPTNEEIRQIWNAAEGHVLSFARSLLYRYGAHHPESLLGNPAPLSSQPAASAEPVGNNHIDDDAVDHFAAAMKDKLAQARVKGRHGWHECAAADLSAMLRAHIEKGDPLDVANFCMFLWSLGKPIVAAPVAQEPIGELECHLSGKATFWPDEDAVFKLPVGEHPVYAAPVAAQPIVTGEMVNRFLGWKLPEDFAPDCGIMFDRNIPASYDGWPSGTNLLTATQARAMLEYALQSVSVTAQAQPVPEGWYLVPLEPTEKMLSAGIPDNAILDAGTQIMFRNGRISSWKHMVGAAPKPSAPGDQK